MISKFLYSVETNSPNSEYEPYEALEKVLSGKKLLTHLNQLFLYPVQIYRIPMVHTRSWQPRRKMGVLGFRDCRSGSAPISRYTSVGIRRQVAQNFYWDLAQALRTLVTIPRTCRYRKIYDFRPSKAVLPLWSISVRSPH